MTPTSLSIGSFSSPRSDWGKATVVCHEFLSLALVSGGQRCMGQVGSPACAERSLNISVGDRHLLSIIQLNIFSGWLLNTKH